MVGGYTVMALCFVIFAFILAAHVRDLERTKARAATVAVHNAGAICLGLSAPSKTEEQAIVDAFLKGDGNITRQFTPTCARAAKKAAEDIFGASNLPAGLQAELEKAINPRSK